ncbi:cytochrome c oxidase subunit II [Jatrophihabitans telluris]|uniref:cytochrome-c oxidase n=1 Tax=Jatrophihabitans telluris TaxID=2038343 RepID=A0ABY4QVC3_9ACTN|nr:cytochrome c oxidase subunit II [Jatrophihabitans telluris]UQX87254.1 cytochrome c oxidase subunit II [Jatrophihabitans telluris]
MQRSLRSGLSKLGLLAGTAVLLSGCTAHDWEMKLRFGWPTGVTKQADRMRTLWTWSSVAALVVGVIVWGLIFWACIRYRKKNDILPRQTKYHLPIEIAYSIAPFLIIAVLFYFTAVTENYVDKIPSNPDTTVQVDAFKWNWQFEYVQSGGTQTKYPANTGAGVADPGAGQNLSTVGSNNEIPILVVPVNKTVKVIEVSRDVIHSFWVPEFLFKRDVLPQKKPNEFAFTATKTGQFVGRCAELCGTYHSQMNFEVRVVSDADYQKYLAALAAVGSTDPNRQSKALTAIGSAPCATTTQPFNTVRTTRSQSELDPCGS